MSVVAFAGAVALAPGAQATELANLSFTSVVSGQPYDVAVGVDSQFGYTGRVGTRTSILEPCTLTVSVTDPDGASGSAAVEVQEGGAQEQNAVDVPASAHGAAFHLGDTVHVVGQLACYDRQTGAMTSFLSNAQDLQISPEILPLIP